MNGEKVKVENCPCCGGGDIYFGYLSANTVGVQCKRRHCGLKLERGLVNYWPKGVTGIDELAAYTAKQAAKAWNRRAKQ